MSVTTADIKAVLRDGDRFALTCLLRVMAYDNPELAATIREAVIEVDNERRAMRGADRVWTEHVEARIEEWSQ